MLRVFVDSGSSIKESEKEKYGVEIIPLKILIDGKEYLDGIDIEPDELYEKMINEKFFPKTSLPNLDEVLKRITEYTNQGDKVIILPISSGISGTYNALKLLFEDNENVRVIDTLEAVGGIRFIVDYVNKNRDKDFDYIEAGIKELIPRIQITAIPKTIDYLQRGGRLSKAEWLVGTILHICPVIGLVNGKVHVHSKQIGLKRGTRYTVEMLNKLGCDPEYGIIAAYTYDKSNLESMIEKFTDENKKLIRVYDNLDPVVGSHWGPYSFGILYVSKK